ncbi:MAG TPA: gephyrin-like molybdotransferase Glp [Burkholderiales bacterium]|jgi:molybdopterin molybdotransferase|nr:gephyrin-like molybdotransferase Glp [Burkholderiales bacterium]
MDTPKSLRELSAADDYDPNSMPVEKARSHIRAFLAPVTAVERLSIRAALGRVLAVDVISPVNVPQHDNSAMDGYAVRFDDLRQDGEATLKVIGAAFAGKPFDGSVGPGQAVRIMTGAVIPQGADTVIQQERAKAVGDQVTVAPVTKRGTNTRSAGEDLRQGEPALKRGQPLRPAEIGLLASLGIGEVPVFRRLRVAFFSTGDELVPVGSPLGAGQIYDSNRYTLYGMLTRLGCDVLDMGVIRDDPKAVQRAFDDAAQSADVVITSGGVSVGEADYVKQILERLGEVLFWKIAMKPGRPLAYGRIGRAHFFGLPGNPVAVMVTFYQFVRDALLYLQGQVAVAPLPTLKVTCTSAIKKAPGRTEFQRGILSRAADGQWTVRTTGDQGSGILSSMSQADCFIVLPTEVGNLPAGAVVDVQLLEGLI